MKKHFTAQILGKLVTNSTK